MFSLPDILAGVDGPFVERTVSTTGWMACMSVGVLGALCGGVYTERCSI